MKLFGLTDSVGGITPALARCQQCGATTRLGNGLCLSCTLREALDEDCQASRESFEAALVRSEVKDTHWRVGNYEILEEIGRGGMGVIYRARQRHSRRIVALKRMVSYHADSRETRERFRREAEAAASLDHPNILPIYEVGQGEDNLPFFSMKYAAGGSLQTGAPALRSNMRECVRLMAKVARAVQYAHEHSIVHRDLKPGNILLDAHGEPFVTDFGLAKWLDANTDLTCTLTIFGTPGYIAPEQAKGSTMKLNPSADTYSLGAILFHLFTGRPPFLGEHALAVIERASEEPAPKLRTLAPASDRDLETICARCLESDPSARYQSAGALADDLERWLDGRPILARRILPSVRAWRWSKRNPKLAGATAAAFCSAMAAIFLFFSHAGLSSPVALVATVIAFCSAIAIPFFFSRKTKPFVAPPQKGIAVLPFRNMSTDPENEYLCDGLTEDLIMAFSRLKGLRVPARTSSFAFKGKNEDVRRIGEELNVAKILEGSVRKVGNRLRITAQLIAVADGDHLWSRTFDRQMQEIFAIQDEITRAIVHALEVQLVGAGNQPLTRHGTYNTDAYELYLQARYHFYKFTGEGFKRCIECCKKALEIDPNYALAYAALSLSYQLGWFYGHLSFEEKLTAIGVHDLAAEKAVELDPNLAETQTALAIVRFWNERDWSRAEECFKQAIELNPNYVTAHVHYAYLLACRRRTDETIIHAHLVRQLDPLSLMNNLGVAGHYWLIHRYDLMLEQAHRLFELESNFFGAYWMLGLAHWSQGMHDAAEPELRKAVLLGGGPVPLADLGCLLGRLGRKAEAQQVLEDLIELGKRMYVQPSYLGFVHASLGNHDQAFNCFAQGIEHENGSIAYLREYCVCAGLGDLLADPRFPALLKKIGLEA
jgi:adenylate cyclase